MLAKIKHLLRERLDRKIEAGRAKLSAAYRNGNASEVLRASQDLDVLINKWYGR